LFRIARDGDTIFLEPGVYSPFNPEEEEKEKEKSVAKEMKEKESNDKRREKDKSKERINEEGGKTEDRQEIYQIMA
jgi:hypothetical protein